VKAVIMAGGEGTRLRPVSINEPKPMARLLDNPALEYILQLLEKNGVTEACLTLKFMPETIIDYISGRRGIKLHTSIEREALGTAGSVRACAEFIGEDDFLVISGDCVCDFDLRDMIAFHKAKMAEATIALYEHPEPLEYGLVVTREDGRIAEFIEKPPWEGVVTNTINTGIYILSPALFNNKVPPGKKYDFGKAFFPAILAENRGLYGMAQKGYWCDIGSPEAYRRCAIDMLEGRVKVNIHAPEVNPGIYSASPIPEGVTIVPPVYIGSNVTLRRGAKIGSRTVIGDNSDIAGTVRDSVVNGATISDGAVIAGAVICKGAVIGKSAAVSEDAVIGEETIIGEQAVIAESVNIWPARQIPAGKTVKSSITHGHIKAGMSFTARGVISGGLGTELTVEDCLKLGQAAASFGRVGLGHFGGDAARIVAETIGCGICARGAELLTFDSGLPSCASFVGERMNLPFTICVNQRLDNVELTCFGKSGSMLSHALERELSSISDRDDAPYTGKIGHTEHLRGVSEIYAAAAMTYAFSHEGGGEGLAVSVTAEESQNKVFKKALTLLGCTVVEQTSGRPCFTLGNDGTALYAIGEDGQQFLPAQMLALICALALEYGQSKLAVPFDAPAAIETLAEPYHAEIYRLGRDGDEAEALYRNLRPLHDGVFAGALICARMKKDGITLTDLMARKVPAFANVEREVPLTRARAEVMGELSKTACELGAEFSDGIRFGVQSGTVLISPLRTKNAIRIRAEGANIEIAEELCTDVLDLLKDF